MTSNKMLKRLIPMVLAGAVMLVLAMPMTASARDWDHDNGRHNGWVHRDRDDFHHYGEVHPDRDDFHHYGRVDHGNLTRMQNVYRQDLATGHPAAANDVARRMRLCGGVSSAYPSSGYYGQNGSMFAPLLGNFLGW